MKTKILFLMVSLCLVGCISAEKYTKLQNELVENQKSIEELEQQNKVQLEEKEAQVYAMEKQISVLNEQINALSSQQMATPSKTVSFSSLYLDSYEKVSDIAELGNKFDIDTYFKLTDIISKVINFMSEDMDIDPFLLPS